MTGRKGRAPTAGLASKPLRRPADKLAMKLVKMAEKILEKRPAKKRAKTPPMRFR